MNLSTARQIVLLYLLSLSILVFVGSLQAGPGYMDADYYYANAKAIANGNFAGEPFLWNYINQPQEIPGPGFVYWMPLTSVVTSIGVWITGGGSFFGARTGLFLIAALIPPLSSMICRQIGGTHNQSLVAGLFAVVPGFYLTFLTTTDAFAIYMVVGGLYLLIINQALKNPDKWWIWGAAGISAGIMHMCRADGILWLLVCLGAIFGSIRKIPLPKFVLAIIGTALGYFFIMAPWYWRNWNEFASLFPPGSSKTLWLTSYDDFFSFPSTSINFKTWLASGWVAIARARIWAGSQNLQTMLAVQGMIFLFPVVLIGLFRARKQHIVRIGVLLWLILFGLMSIVWPFPGARGSFYHSAAGVQVLFWAAIPLGMQGVVGWAATKRNWDLGSATKFFSTSFLVLAIILTGYLAYNNLDLRSRNSWGSEISRYAAIESYLMTIDPTKTSVVMVNNPPAFSLASQRQSIVIPAGEISAAIAAADQFYADFLILEPDTNHPAIYGNPASQDGLQYLETIQSARVFKFNR